MTSLILEILIKNLIGDSFKMERNRTLWKGASEIQSEEDDEEVEDYVSEYDQEASEYPRRRP